MSDPTQPAPAEIQARSDQLTHIAQEMYKKNMELAETNHTLMLLRRIDDIVLSSVSDKGVVLRRVAEAISQDSDFSFSMIYLRNKQKRSLVPGALVSGSKDEKLEKLAQTTLLHHAVTLRHTANPMARTVEVPFIASTTRLYEIVQPNLEFSEADELQKQLKLEQFFICPLIARGAVLGTMVLGTTLTSEALSFYQKSLLERLTVAVGLALDNTLLYTEAQESSRRLQVANRHLKELDKAKDEFISLASHQLRTPLTSIKGYVSMLLEGEAGAITKEQHEFLDYAYRGSQRMVSLISDLLNVSRMSAGKFYIEREPLDIAAIVEEEIQQLQQHPDAKKLKLTYVAPKKPLPLLNLDENKTRQVIMNLIDNAIYYTREGGVTVMLAQEGQHAVLRVSDTGIGVPKTARAKLFGKFFRANNAQTIRPDGTGLGLFLAKRVIEEQGGTILFESVEGKGSTFGFSLPLKEKGN
ncbi:MAG TPA: HAMP domain-containing sensor histidine kinase [Candidatus Saccharimonadia bacterium]